MIVVKYSDSYFVFFLKTDKPCEYMKRENG